MAVNSSVPVIWTVPIYTTVPGTTTPETTEETVVDNNVSAPIDTSIASQPYNFLLGSTAVGDATPTVIDAGAAAVAPVTDGEPESSVLGANGVPSDLGADGAINPADLDPSVFAGPTSTWTSEQQSEYLNYWISQDQLAYGTTVGDYNVANGTNYSSWAQVVAVIGSGTNQITAVLSATTPGTVYIVNNLEASDFDSMSLADQEAIAGTAYFQNTLAPELQLTINTNLANGPSDLTAANIPSSLVSISTGTTGGIQQEIDKIEGTTTAPTTTETSEVIGNYTGAFPTVGSTSVTNADGSVTTTATVKNGSGATTYYTTTQTTTNADGSGQSTQTDIYPPGTYAGQTYTTATYIATTSVTTTNEVTIQTPSGSVTVTGMPAADKAAFIGELQLLQTQLSNQAIVSDSQISTDVQAITQRFARAAAFWTQATPTTTSTGYGSTQAPNVVQLGVVSVDGNAAISQTYQTLIQQEQQILATEQNAYNVASSGMIGAVQPDAPTLIAYFQMNTDATEQATITADTSELSAINDELQEYSAMQTLVNSTLGTFGASSTSTSTATLDGQTTASGLTPAQLSAAEMFDAGSGTTPSPLDLLLGIARPTTNLLNIDGTTLPGYTQTQWNSFNTSLSNAVTQLQQQSQILTDNINEETQEQDNEFSLGNDALSKMSDMIDEIGRGLAD